MSDRVPLGSVVSCGRILRYARRYGGSRLRSRGLPLRRALRGKSSLVSSTAYTSDHGTTRSTAVCCGRSQLRSQGRRWFRLAVPRRRFSCLGSFSVLGTMPSTGDCYGKRQSPSPAHRSSHRGALRRLLCSLGFFTARGITRNIAAFSGRSRSRFSDLPWSLRVGPLPPSSNPASITGLGITPSIDGSCGPCRSRLRQQRGYPLYGSHSPDCTNATTACAGSSLNAGPLYGACPSPSQVRGKRRSSCGPRGTLSVTIWGDKWLMYRLVSIERDGTTPPESVRCASFLPRCSWKLPTFQRRGAAVQWHQSSTAGAVGRSAADADRGL